MWMNGVCLENENFRKNGESGETLFSIDPPGIRHTWDHILRKSQPANCHANSGSTWTRYPWRVRREHALHCSSKTRAANSGGCGM